MGLMRSLSAGVSGLQNHQVMMDVLGNNISNANTIGFKSGRASFSEAFAQTLRGGTQPYGEFGGTNPMQIGLGITLSSIDTLFGQGNIESTGQTTDLAIQGEGFFIVKDGTSRRFTRAGNFKFDSNNTLVIPGTGVRVQGYIANSEGEIEAGSPLTDITLPFGKIGAKATSEMNFAGNLDASAKPIGNVLKTKGVFAIEKGTSDISGLLASGNADARITGLIPNSSEVEINYGGVTKNYKYLSVDTGVGNGAFNSINDLINEFNNDFGAAGLTVSLNTNGSLNFSGNDVLSLSSNNPILKDALESAGGDLSTGDRTSDIFSHVAQSTDLLIDLLDENGQSLQLAVGDEILINGLKGGSAISTATLQIGAGTTINEFLSEIETAFNITNSDGVEFDVTDGGLTINADGGELYEISAVDIRADDTAGAGGTDRTLFNAIFDSTPGHYTQLQEAKDVVQSATTTVYDSQGNTYDLTTVFTKDVTEPNRWKWQIEVKDGVVSGGYSGYVEFNSDGSLKNFSFDDGSSLLQFTPENESSSLISIELNVGTNATFDGITQLAGNANSVQITAQNGHGMGALERIIIDEAGRISGAFTNGIVQTLAGIAIGTFANPSGLVRMQGNLFTVDGNSGDPIISSPGEGVNSEIISGALEQSNVDLAEEFTKMIVAQRAFQANARIITTSDDLLQEVTNLKR